MAVRKWEESRIRERSGALDDVIDDAVSLASAAVNHVAVRVGLNLLQRLTGELGVEPVHLP